MKMIKDLRVFYRGVWVPVDLLSKTQLRKVGRAKAYNAAIHAPAKSK